MHYFVTFLFLKRKREPVVLLLLCYGCLFTVNVLVCLQCVIMVFTDHTHLLFKTWNSQTCLSSPVIVILTVPRRRFYVDLFYGCVKIVSEYDQ